MRLGDLVGATLGEFLGRLLWRAGAALLVVVAVLAAIYHLTAAGTLALTAHYGALNAYLFVGGGYAVAALIVVGILLATRRKPSGNGAVSAAALLSSPRGAQVALLLEAAMIGFLAAKKTSTS